MPRRKKSDEGIMDITRMAEDLGVSKTTVSRALSGNGRVSEATRQRVVDYAREKNYVPNMMAKSLVTKKSYNVALVFSRQFSNFEGQFLRKTITAVCDVMARNDYDVLLAMVGTEFYDELYSLLRFWWIGLLAAAALLVHIGAYARAPRNGGCLHGMVAVSVATLLGGLGFISREEYFSPTALYYSLGLGVVMLLVYVLCRSEADRPRDYDVAERMLQILYAGGLFTGFVVALFYVRNLQEFLQNFATIYFKYRNFSATMLLIALPAAAYFAAHDRRHFLSVAFLYFMLLMTGSRSGLIFGTAMLLLCLAYVYYCNPERRAFYRRVGLISLIPAVALLIALVPRLFASRMVDGALISPDDSRYTFFIQGLLDFVKNPLFGCGLGSMHNAPIFLGVEGSIVWYHNLIAQILGSMGLVGVVGYGWLFYDRVRLLWRKRSRTTMAFALSYFAMLLISMTNPGMFCPMPNALLMVAMFVVIERQPDTAAVPVKVGSASTPERRLF